MPATRSRHVNNVAPDDRHLAGAAGVNEGSGYTLTPGRPSATRRRTRSAPHRYESALGRRRALGHLHGTSGTFKLHLCRRPRHADVTVGRPTRTATPATRRRWSRSTTWPRRSPSANAGQVNEGSPVSVTLGRHRPRPTRRRLQLRLQLGRRHLRVDLRLAARPRHRPTPTPTAPAPRRSRPTSSTRTAASPSTRTDVTVNNVAPTIAICGAASVNEGSSYSLTLGAVTDPGTDTVSSYVVHWGDGSSNTYTHERRQDPHLRRRPQRLRHHGRPDRRGRHLPQRRQRPERRRVNNVAPTIAISGDAQRQRGLGLQPDPGRGHRSGHRHGHQLRRPLGRRQQQHLRQRTASRRTPTPTAPTTYAITVDLVDEDGTFTRPGQRPQRHRQQRGADGRNRHGGIRSDHARGHCHSVVHGSRQA